MEPLSVATTVLGLVGLLAAAVTVWRSAGQTQASKIWREEAEAQKARGDRLEEGLADLRAEFSAYRTETSSRIALLEQENDLLRDLVTGREAVKQLESLTRELHAETASKLAHLESLILEAKK